MGKTAMVAAGRFGEVPKTVYRVPTLEQRVQAHLEDGTASVHLCTNAWAMRRRFRTSTGEEKLFRCDLWTCEYCGPRKVVMWRRLIEQAPLTHHLVLTKAGKTIEEASRALTTFMQALRRGSKGRGHSRMGARQAYPVEYLAVLEEHEDFEENGFHWHILLVSLDAQGNIVDIPYKEVIVPLWTSAVFGKDRQHLRKTVIDKKTGEVKLEERLGWIKRVKIKQGISYVTKYLMKEIIKERKGVRLEERQVLTGFHLNEQEKLEANYETIQEERVSHARRIRYSKGFFPASTKELRMSLFAQAEQGQEETTALGEERQQEEPVGTKWTVKEIAPPCKTPQQYYVLLRHGLRQQLEEHIASGRRLSRRVLMLWNTQRTQRATKRYEAWVDLDAATCEQWCGRQVEMPRSDGTVDIGLVVSVSPDGEVEIALPDDPETGEAGVVMRISLRTYEVGQWPLVSQIVGL